MSEVVHLSALLGRRIADRQGESVGKVTDVIVRLGGQGYPLVTGLVARVGRDVFLPVGQVGPLTDTPLQLLRPQVDLRRFERREGEVLLRADLLKHRLIQVPDAELVRAWDVELVQHPQGWLVEYLDTRRPRRFFGLLPVGAGSAREDWKSFEPLVGHVPSAKLRGVFGQLRGLKPAQIADLLEDASKSEETEILEAVHADPELEADVFEELEPDRQSKVFGTLGDQQVADVLGRMRADDAADALADLPQGRRELVLGLLPPGQRTKVMTLLGFNPSSAGGLMSVEFVTVPVSATLETALDAVRRSTGLQPEALSSVYTTDEQGRLAGVVRLTQLVQGDASTRLDDIDESAPVHVHADTDVIDVALQMSDYNLVTIPVCDEEHHIVGIVTVDDVLEATIPDDWRRREPSEHPESHSLEPPSSAEPPHELPHEQSPVG